MSAMRLKSSLAEEIRWFVLEGFAPHYGELAETAPSSAPWRRLRELGSQLWLDTGSLHDARKLWTQEFSALTTNNTLLNREVQTGLYDAFIIRAGELLSARADLSQHDKLLEIDFILNAWHALRLVEQFDAYVSVEEHTDLADDVEMTVDIARRYHAICPRRFTIKVPFTPAGLLATRRLVAEGIPVNHTLGFSARQNYVAARLARPAFVNVFLGRLNTFVVDNDLGPGVHVGERATLASQAAIRRLRTTAGIPTKQIGASFRQARQVRDLIGIDVMTMPPKVASDFLALGVPRAQLVDRTGEQYLPPLREGVNAAAVRLDTLWVVEPALMACVDKLTHENLDAFTPDDLVGFFADHGCGDVLVKWTDDEIAISAAEGKIPRVDNWRAALAEKAIGLDSLMNLAGFNAFATDQRAMDARVANVLAGHGTHPGEPD